ncbi:hypothetical protein C9J85_09950 [Haloferax sp. wsp5]|nr:hypothetical protein C9J85_09950 [Haloferax sp. wsp5]
MNASLRPFGRNYVRGHPDDSSHRRSRGPRSPFPDDKSRRFAPWTLPTLHPDDTLGHRVRNEPARVWT